MAYWGENLQHDGGAELGNLGDAVTLSELRWCACLLCDRQGKPIEMTLLPFRGPDHYCASFLGGLY